MFQNKSTDLFQLVGNVNQLEQQIADKYVSTALKLAPCREKSVCCNFSLFCHLILRQTLVVPLDSLSHLDPATQTRIE